MATGILFEFNGMNEKQYDGINDLISLYGNPPRGLILHTAGPASTGQWRVFDIWESKDLFEQFFKQRLQPVFNQIGLNQPPVKQEYFPIHNAYTPQPSLLTNLTNASTAATRR